MMNESEHQLFSFACDYFLYGGPRSAPLENKCEPAWPPLPFIEHGASHYVRANELGVGVQVRYTKEYLMIEDIIVKEYLMIEDIIVWDIIVHQAGRKATRHS